MAEKTDKFEHLKKVKHNQKDLQKLIAKVKSEHSRAFLAAEAKHLLDKAGNPDYSKLEDNKIRLEYADTMADFYRERVMKHFGIKDLDAFGENILLDGFYGITREELRAQVGAHGPSFNHDKYITELAPQLIEKLQNRLIPATYSHLRHEHIPDIVKYTNTGKFVDPGSMTLDEAVRALLVPHLTYGNVTRKMLRKDAPFLLKAQKKK